MSELVLGIKMPQDFPSHSWLTFEKLYGECFPAGSETHRLIAGGWNGLAHQYASMDNSHKELVSSLEQYPGGIPPHPERHKEETELFTFASSVVSSVECGFFALHALCNCEWKRVNN